MYVGAFFGSALDETFYRCFVPYHVPALGHSTTKLNDCAYYWYEYHIIALSQPRDSLTIIGLKYTFSYIQYIYLVALVAAHHLHLQYHTVSPRPQTNCHQPIN
jgi:hypothetical protein